MRIRVFVVTGLGLCLQILSYPAPVVESSDVVLSESHKDSKTTIAGKTDKVSAAA